MTTPGISGAANEISMIHDAAAELSKLKGWIEIQSSTNSSTAGKRDFDLISGLKFTAGLI
jgi:hypothetical protein